MSGRLKNYAKRCVGAAALVAGVVSFAAQARALDPRLCTQHGDLVNQLGKKYGESVTASGFDGAGKLRTGLQLQDRKLDDCHFHTGRTDLRDFRRKRLAERRERAA